MSIGSASFEINVDQLVDLSVGLENIPVAIRRNLLDAANKSAIRGVTLAKEHVPVWEGKLRDDIHAEPSILSEQGVSVVISTSLPYAATMEYGRRAGAPMPPQGVLLAWMASKGIPPEAEYPLRRKIGRDGIPGHFFMQFAYDQLSLGIVEQLFGAGIDQALAQFVGAT